MLLPRFTLRTFLLACVLLGTFVGLTVSAHVRWMETRAAFIREERIASLESALRQMVWKRQFDALIRKKFSYNKEKAIAEFKKDRLYRRIEAELAELKGADDGK